MHNRSNNIIDIKRGLRMCGEEPVGRGTEIQKDMIYVHIFKQFCFVGVLG